MPTPSSANERCSACRSDAGATPTSWELSPCTWPATARAGTPATSSCSMAGTTLSERPGGDPSKLVHLYTGADGRSHFADLELATSLDAGGVLFGLQTAV